MKLLRRQKYCKRSVRPFSGKLPNGRKYLLNRASNSPTPSPFSTVRNHWALPRSTKSRYLSAISTEEQTCLSLAKISSKTPKSSFAMKSGLRLSSQTESTSNRCVIILPPPSLPRALLLSNLLLTLALVGLCPPQTHLICSVPAYDAPCVQQLMHQARSGKSSPPPSSSSLISGHGGQPALIEVNLMVKSGGKCSDPHKFYYTIGAPAPHLLPGDEASNCDTNDAYGHGK